jgi:hypothetical protein
MDPTDPTVAHLMGPMDLMDALLTTPTGPMDAHQMDLTDLMAVLLMDRMGQTDALLKIDHRGTTAEEEVAVAIHRMVVDLTGATEIVVEAGATAGVMIVATLGEMDTGAMTEDTIGVMDGVTMVVAFIQVN